MKDLDLRLTSLCRGLSQERRRVGPLTGVYKNMARGIVALVFRCVPVNGTPNPTAEAREVRWLEPDEIAARMADAYAVRMLDALAGGAPSIRSHDGVDIIYE